MERKSLFVVEFQALGTLGKELIEFGGVKRTHAIIRFKSAKLVLELELKNFILRIYHQIRMS